MNKLTYEYQKTQFYNNLVDLQCKCAGLDTPRIGPIWGFFGREIIKSILKHPSKLGACSGAVFELWLC